MYQFTFSHCDLSFHHLSYLHRSPGTSTPDDSSSVESEIDEVMDNVVANTAAKKSDDAVQEVTTSAAVKNRNKMKKNGIAKDMEPRMKKVSVEMKKMRKERWSLDTGGSSGDEGGRYQFNQCFEGLISIDFWR